MGKKLFVGNLNFKTNDDDLRTLFSQAGTCESATVMMDRATGRSRGFGFVEMSSDEEALKAVQQFNGYDFQGRNLNVNEARERTPGGPRPGGYAGAVMAAAAVAAAGRRLRRRRRWRLRRWRRLWRWRRFGGGGGFGGGDFGGGGGGDFGGGFGGGGGGNFKPRKEGGSRRGLRAKKRSL